MQGTTLNFEADCSKRPKLLKWTIDDF